MQMYQSNGTYVVENATNALNNLLHFSAKNNMTTDNSTSNSHLTVIVAKHFITWQISIKYRLHPIISCGPIML